MKKKKVFVILGVIAVAIFSLGTPSLAADELELANPTSGMYNLIGPLWNDTIKPNLWLSIQGSTVNCDGTIKGLTGTTKIDATFRLEKKGWFGWSEVNSWNRTSYSDYLSFSGSAGAESGATYRFSVVAAVTRNGRTETVSSSVEGRN